MMLRCSVVSSTVWPNLQLLSVQSQGSNIRVGGCSSGCQSFRPSQRDVERMFATTSNADLTVTRVEAKSVSDTTLTLFRESS